MASTSATERLRDFAGNMGYENSNDKIPMSNEISNPNVKRKVIALSSR